jgi:phosphotransferase system  glucose/maltose/N-acetylglucosamine-specific IIC component
MSNTPNKKFVAGIWEQNKKNSSSTKNQIQVFVSASQNHPKKYIKTAYIFYNLILTGVGFVMLHAVDNGTKTKPRNMSATSLLASSL